ncbi:DUF3017 domain-containing protein [uncultured Pseudokineococcus sp.]|uniref:DUF3017 domain-containing protein n=1 Tax=uncultured Pseudokineococcus sp. TaxID=1642928 RepID=UPI0026204B3D|nr:DUF3017 domain-containing protein [uncultured Pseudokineococcus sp.]
MPEEGPPDGAEGAVPDVPEVRGRASEVDTTAGRRGSAVLLAVAALVAGALVAGVVLGFRATGLVLGAGLVVVAVVRLTGSTRAAGPLAVRSRAVDAAVVLVLAAALVVLSLLTPGGEPRV